MATQELTNQDVAQLLDDARELMNDKGAHWVKGRLRETDRKTKEVSFCSVGAIYHLTRGEDRRKKALRKAALAELSESIRHATYGWSGSMIMGWNDAPNRTWSQVSSKFTSTAKKLRKRKTRSKFLP